MVNEFSHGVKLYNLWAPKSDWGLKDSLSTSEITSTNSSWSLLRLKMENRMFIPPFWNIIIINGNSIYCAIWKLPGTNSVVVIDWQWLTAIFDGQ